MSLSEGPPATTARDAILARVQEALREGAPPPHGMQTPLAHLGGSVESHGHPATAGDGRLLAILPADAARPWLPDGGESSEERIAVLAENLARLRAGFERVGSIEEACERIVGLCLERQWMRVAGHRHPFVDRVLERAAVLPGRTIVRVDAVRSGDGDSTGPHHGFSGGGPSMAPRFDKDALEACDLGVTACEAIISQTGSVLVASGSSGGRSLSVLPHAHVVVAAADQVVPTLADALELVRSRHGGGLPSMLSFITGPSRTGDIERILVLGAHGPKELVVVLVG